MSGASASSMSTTASGEKRRTEPSMALANCAPSSVILRNPGSEKIW
jgi:hypothetical protein